MRYQCQICIAEQRQETVKSLEEPELLILMDSPQMVTAMNQIIQIIMKSLDPLRAKKTFIRKKLGHTTVSAIKASVVNV